VVVTVFFKEGEQAVFVLVKSLCQSDTVRVGVGFVHDVGEPSLKSFFCFCYFFLGSFLFEFCSIFYESLDVFMEFFGFFIVV
jgi:hypothetical protein